MKKDISKNLETANKTLELVDFYLKSKISKGVFDTFTIGLEELETASKEDYFKFMDRNFKNRLKLKLEEDPQFLTAQSDEFCRMYYTNLNNFFDFSDKVEKVRSSEYFNHVFIKNDCGILTAHDDICDIIFTFIFDNVHIEYNDDYLFLNNEGVFYIDYKALQNIEQEGIEEAQYLIDYINDNLVDDIINRVREMEEMANYIEDFKKNQIKYFTEWLIDGLFEE